MVSLPLVPPGKPLLDYTHRCKYRYKYFSFLSHFSHSVVLAIISMNSNSSYIHMTTASAPVSNLPPLPDVLPPGQGILKSWDPHFEVLFDNSLPCIAHSQSCRLLCPWNSPDKNTAAGSHSLLQGIFPTQWFSCVSCIGRQILSHLCNFGPELFLFSWTVARITNQLHHLWALLILMHPKWSSSWGLV